jgi:hypothetical protein
MFIKYSAKTIRKKTNEEGGGKKRGRPNSAIKENGKTSSNKSGFLVWCGHDEISLRSFFVFVLFSFFSFFCYPLG